MAAPLVRLRWPPQRGCRPVPMAAPARAVMPVATAVAVPVPTAVPRIPAGLTAVPVPSRTNRRPDIGADAGARAGTRGGADRADRSETGQRAGTSAFADRSGDGIADARGSTRASSGTADFGSGRRPYRYLSPHRRLGLIALPTARRGARPAGQNRQLRLRRNAFANTRCRQYQCRRFPTAARGLAPIAEAVPVPKAGANRCRR